jgi:hypothetical protein
MRVRVLKREVHHELVALQGVARVISVAQSLLAFREYGREPKINEQ